MTEKLLVGIISAIASGTLTYAFKATAIEGRLAAVEIGVHEIAQTVKRIEEKTR